MVNLTHYKMQLSKLNEVYLKLEVDSSLSKELANYFTFEVPGEFVYVHFVIVCGMEKLDCFQNKQEKYMLVFYHT